MTGAILRSTLLVAAAFGSAAGCVVLPPIWVYSICAAIVVFAGVVVAAILGARQLRAGQ